MPTLPGLHHVTAICSDPQANLNFYTRTLGLRLVKLTVNFDDPGSYHLYYGDSLGHPGTIMTFFSWPAAYRGRVGMPQATATAFAVPPGSIPAWTTRLTAASVPFAHPGSRFGTPCLTFPDPDGLILELIESPTPGTGDPWPASPVPRDIAITGFHGVTLSEEGHDRTADTLTALLGFRETAAEGNRFRYETASGGPGSTVDILCTPDARPGSLGVGTVHHVAFRAATDDDQAAFRRAVASNRFNVSPVMDRTYFRSIYFREPGGVLFEIATDAPGFTTDESPASLGSSLQLPPSLEPLRPRIQQLLPPLTLPHSLTPRLLLTTDY